MAWLQANGLTVIIGVFFLFMVLRGPILARVYGIINISAHDLAARLSAKADVLLVDVRTPGEFASGHIQQAELAPLSDLSQLGPQLLQRHGDRQVAVICRSGNRSLMGAVALKRAGFSQVANVAGGMIHWQGQGYPVKR